MDFDYLIGNPPFQDSTIGDNDTFAPPVYDKFMDAVFPVATKVELIHPARFLFNAGSTPKQWNKKMLNDTHFKILHCEVNSKAVFPNADIKGGVAISYRNKAAKYGAIGTFTTFPELNSIMRKVVSDATFESLETIAFSAYAYHFSERLYEDNPHLVVLPSKGHEYDLKSNVFEYMAEVFFSAAPNDGNKYAKVLGRLNNERVYKYINSNYLVGPENYKKFKVFIAGANGSGSIGETMSTPLIGTPLMGTPLIGNTESFMSIGCFDSESEASNAMKYIKTKFSRTLLGILKVTQNITPGKYHYVPKQDFSSASDIDWTQPISEIDRQLYKKYGLSVEEIDFIESHVKAMA